MMSIRSLADFNGGPLGGAVTGETPPPSPPRAPPSARHDEGPGTSTWPPAGTSPGHPRGPLPDHYRGLFHGHGQLSVIDGVRERRKLVVQMRGQPYPHVCTSCDVEQVSQP